MRIQITKKINIRKKKHKNYRKAKTKNERKNRKNYQVNDHKKGHLIANHYCKRRKRTHKHIHSLTYTQTQRRAHVFTARTTRKKEAAFTLLHHNIKGIIAKLNKRKEGRKHSFSINKKLHLYPLLLHSIFYLQSFWVSFKRLSLKSLNEHCSIVWMQHNNYRPMNERMNEHIVIEPLTVTLKRIHTHKKTYISPMIRWKPSANMNCSHKFGHSHIN